MASHEVSALRALTYRLTSTPTAHLPRYVAQLSAALWACRDLLAAANELSKHSAGDGSAAIIHRLRTQLTSLLQDRSIEGRWAAVVLVKTYIEAAGVEVALKTNGWPRHLLSILKRPDPPTTRALVVLVLTRTFMLTWPSAILVREITTPVLPTFVSTCLSNASNKHCSSVELLNILESFELLLPRHPTIFRSNESALRSLLSRVISGDDVSFSREHIAVAQRVHAILPHVAPKQGGAEKWVDELNSLIIAAHDTCSQIFHPIIESKRSDDVRDQKPASSSLLTPQQGVSAGAARLITLIECIEAFVESTTPSAVALPLGRIFQLLSRILSVTPLKSGKQSFTKPNPEVTRDERDLLYTALPEIHVASFRLLSSIVSDLGPASISFASACYEHAAEVFAAEEHDHSIRKVLYGFVAQLLDLNGPVLRKDAVSKLLPVLQHCCRDLQTAPQVTALRLLRASLARLDPQNVPRNVRTQLDRTAILLRDKDALLASVLNPAANPSGSGLQTSVLPFLARLFPDEPEVEALLRPRMPVVRSGGADAEEAEEEASSENDEKDDDANMEDEEEAPQQTSQTTEDRSAAEVLAYESFVEAQQKRALTSDNETMLPVKRQRADHFPQQEDPTDAQTTADTAEIAVADIYSDDGSDIEFPPLTLEQDTEDEED